jgi:hypothetical protein
MQVNRALALFAALAAAFSLHAQQLTQPTLSLNPSNRTLAVSGDVRATADADIAILHIGFETPPCDAKKAYSEGGRISNAIVTALKQAGIPEPSIHTDSQHLNREYPDQHKYKLVEEWSVKVPPDRVAEILDVAVGAGAAISGDVDWALNDEKALEEQALQQAALRARQNAEVLARTMGVRLGTLIYTTNEVVAPQPVLPRGFGYLTPSSAGAVRHEMQVGPPLAIEPRRVSREVTVYAVFAIE